MLFGCLNTSLDYLMDSPLDEVVTMYLHIPVTLRYFEDSLHYVVVK